MGLSLAETYVRFRLLSEVLRDVLRVTMSAMG